MSDHPANNHEALLDTAPVASSLLLSGGADLSSTPATIAHEPHALIALADKSEKSATSVLEEQILALPPSAQESTIQSIIREVPIWCQAMLFDAIESDNEVIVALLVKADMGQLRKDVGFDWLSDEDYLHVASRQGNVEILEVLSESGDISIDPISQIHGMTPLMEAALHGHVACVDYLLSKGADPMMKDSIHETSAICWAAKGGNVDVFDLLVKSISHSESSIEEKTVPHTEHIDTSTLCNAILSGSLAMVKRVFDDYSPWSDANDGLNQTPDPSKVMVMQAFLQSDSEEVIDHVLDTFLSHTFADLTKIEDSDFNFLVAAAAHMARQKNDRSMRKLLDIILHPQFLESGRTDPEKVINHTLISLCEAPTISTGKTETILKTLLTDYGADPNFLNQPHADTALYHAVAHIEHGEINDMFEYGVHSRNHDMGFPPFYTTIRTLCQISNLDIAAGKFANGPTPLWLAIWSNAYNTALRLIEAGSGFEYIDPAITEDTEWLWVTAAKVYRCPVKIYAGTYLSALTAEEKRELQSDLEAQNARLMVIDRMKRAVNHGWPLDRDLTLRQRARDEDIVDVRAKRIPSQDDIDLMNMNLREHYRTKTTTERPATSDFPDPMYWHNRIWAGTALSTL